MYACASRSYTVLAISNCVEYDITSYTVLKHVEVEFWCGTCSCDTGTQCSVQRFNVEAAHFGARMLKRQLPGGGGHAKQKRNLAFSGGKYGWNWRRQSGNLDLDCYIRYCWWWSRLPSFATAESDQVSKAPESGLPSLATADDGHQNHLLLLLLSLIRTTFPRYCRWGQPDCLLSLLLGTIRSPKLQSPDCLLLRLLGTICRWLLFTCQSVPLSLSFWCFTERSNLSTRTRGFCMLTRSAEGPGACESRWKWWVRGSGFPHENFSQFHPLLFTLLFGMPPPLQVAAVLAF